MLMMYIKVVQMRPCVQPVPTCTLVLELPDLNMRCVSCWLSVVRATHVTWSIKITQRSFKDE